MAGTGPDGGGGNGGAALAVLLTLGWLAVVAALGWQMQTAGTTLPQVAAAAAVLLAVVVPVALLWLAVGLAQLRADLRAEMAAHLRRLEGAQAQAPTPPLPDPAPEPVPEPVPVDPGLALARFVSRREAALAETGTAQRGLPLDPPRAGLPLTLDEVIRALDFPRDASDAIGFELLRRALHDPALAEVIRSAEEVLSGLAQEGIEVRDLVPDRARPEVWRSFAQGVRGPGVAALGGIRDRAVLARAAARMRADPAFRDAAHRFLRGFDLRLAALEAQAGDAQIVRLAETRAARAFMILGRATGIFG